MDKHTIQMLIEKLDRNLVTLSEAKDWVKSTYNLTVEGRTKQLWIRSLVKAVQS